MATIYARLINQYKYKYHTSFSASFYKTNEEEQQSDETELFFNWNMNHNLTESDIKNIDVKFQLEHQIQETKERGWIFDKINSVKFKFYKTEINRWDYVKIPLRSNAILKIENIDKYCFFWSLLAYFHPCENTRPSSVTNYIQYCDEMNIEGSDFSKVFRCSDIHRFEKLNNLSINIFEINFFQDQNKWNYNLLPFEISRNESDKIFDLRICKNHCALIKKINRF